MLDVQMPSHKLLQQYLRQALVKVSLVMSIFLPHGHDDYLEFWRHELRSDFEVNQVDMAG